MWFKTILLMLSLAVAAGSALATPDDGTDSFGIYFAPDLETNCASPVPFTPFHLYFMIANPSSPWISSFEFGARFEPEPAVRPTILSVLLPPHCTNLGDAYNYVVGMDTNLPTTQATVLVTMELLFVAPINPLTAIMACNASYVGEDGEVQLTYSTYDPAHGQDIGPDGCIAVASFTCLGGLPIATETATFGAVKALYR